ncbi:MAG: hypothetical protein NTY19_09305 [Planctomycetota bacterium]|nr:hypothetical protein [Planctomycetota bacterium]
MYPIPQIPHGLELGGNDLVFSWILDREANLGTDDLERDVRLLPEPAKLADGAACGNLLPHSHAVDRLDALAAVLGVAVHRV